MHPFCFSYLFWFLMFFLLCFEETIVYTFINITKLYLILFTVSFCYSINFKVDFLNIKTCLPFHAVHGYGILQGESVGMRLRVAFFPKVLVLGRHFLDVKLLKQSPLYTHSLSQSINVCPWKICFHLFILLFETLLF